MGINNLIQKTLEDTPSYANTNKKILCVVNLQMKNGTGHLYRTLKFMKRLGNNCFLYAPDKSVLNLIKLIGFTLPIERISTQPETEGPWDLIILDNHNTSRLESERWMNLSYVIALDEGGECRKLFPYIIDTLPTLLETESPNEFNTGYLDLPLLSSAERSNPPKKILVTFGGSDHAQLTEKIGLMLDSHGLSATRWSVAKGAFFRRTFAWPGVKIFENPNVAELMADFDLIITHFGLTAFEAIASGANVILFNPTPYHEKLAKIAGFPSLGVAKIPEKTQKTFMNYLKGDQKNPNWHHKVKIHPIKNLAERILNLNYKKTTCPACSEKKHLFGTIIYRDYNKSYAECPSCKLIYQLFFTKIDMRSYQNSFYDEHKKSSKSLQPNKLKLLKPTEFQAHWETKVSETRLKKIISKLRIENRNLLDIGCSYGDFMQVAHNQGFNVRGIETNSQAAEHVRTILQLPVLDAKFPEDFSENDSKYAVITLWHVLEHFDNLGNALQKLNSLLQTGGILAISSMQGDGMIAKYFRKQFFKEHYIDHYTIFTRKNIVKILENYNFKIVLVQITDIHPEHIRKKLIPGKLYNFYKWLYHMKLLGDTLEVYAIKKD